MRTHLPACLAVLALAAPADAATRNFGITDFTRIRVAGPYRVQLVTGVAPFARASGSQSALDRVAIEVRGDTLVVQPNASWGGYSGSDIGPIEVAVGTHDLNRASVVGSGAVAIDRVKGLSFALTVQGSGAGQIGDVAVDQMNISLEGTASARVAGKTGKLVALVRGVSALDAAALSTPSADIDADGTATIDAEVTDTARVNGWGPATVRLTGNPSCTLKVSGAATVSGCHSTQ
jgi:hypothetical protein